MLAMLAQRESLDGMTISSWPVSCFEFATDCLVVHLECHLRASPVVGAGIALVVHRLVRSVVAAAAVVSK